jgi:hypothetical protein
VYIVRTTQTVRGQAPYKTYLRYAGGLAPGANVLFGGIKVGQVTAVGPASEDPTRIEIAFEVKTGTPINQKSTAQVGSVSIMSSPALSITTGSNDARRLSAGEVVGSQEAVSLEEITRRVAVVAESANVLITTLGREVPILTGDARKFLANLNEISGPRNQKQIEGILADLNTLLKRESPKIAQITDQISALAKHADSVVESVEPVFANVDRRDLPTDNIHAAIQRAIGPLLQYEILSVVPWIRKELVAETYQKGCCFILGDAAHVMSPTGAYGMNTGIGDAVDLAWKLAAAVEGWGGMRLLGSFDAERRPIAHRNVTEASSNLRRMRSPGRNDELLDDTEAGAATRRSTRVWKRSTKSTTTRAWPCRSCSGPCSSASPSWWRRCSC